MSAEEIDNVFGEKSTKFDKLLQTASKELEVHRKKNRLKAKELDRATCVALVRSPGDFCGAQQGQRCKCTGVVVINTKQKGMWGKIKRRFSIGAWATNYLVKHWEKKDSGRIALCEVHKKRIHMANPAMWVAMAGAMATVAVAGYYLHGWNNRRMERNKIQGMLGEGEGGEHFITTEEATEFNKMGHLTQQEKVDYLKSSMSESDWKRYQKNFAFQNGKLLSTKQANDSWKNFEAQMKESTLDADGLTGKDVRAIHENMNGVTLGKQKSLIDTIKGNKYSKFNDRVNEATLGGFASKDAEQNIQTFARDNKIDWDTETAVNKRLADAIKRRDDTQRAIDDAMKSDKGYVSGNNEWDVTITTDEMKRIRATAGVGENDSLPVNMHSLIDTEDVKQAIGKGVVEEVAVRAASRKIITDADYRRIEEMRKRHGIKATLADLERKSPALRAAVQNRGQYERLKATALRDGLIDGKETGDIEGKLGITRGTFTELTGSDAKWQEGVEEMNKARSTLREASTDMYLTTKESDLLTPAIRKALKNENSEDYQLLRAAETNTAQLTNEMKYLKPDDTRQATKELFAGDMMKSRKKFVNQQQANLKKLKGNVGFKAAVKEHGLSVDMLEKREKGLDVEARQLARATAGQRVAQRAAAQVAHAANRVVDLEKEAKQIRSCMGWRKNTPFCKGIGTAKKQKAVLKRLSKSIAKLKGEKMSGHWAVDTAIGKRNRFSQSALSAQEAIDETVRGRQLDRAEYLRSLPDAAADKVKGAARSARDTASGVVTGAATRAKQAARVVDKATGEWVGVGAARGPDYKVPSVDLKPTLRKIKSPVATTGNKGFSIGQQPTNTNPSGWLGPKEVKIKPGEFATGNTGSMNLKPGTTLRKIKSPVATTGNKGSPSVGLKPTLRKIKPSVWPTFNTVFQ